MDCCGHPQNRPDRLGNSFSRHKTPDCGRSRGLPTRIARVRRNDRSCAQSLMPPLTFRCAESSAFGTCRSKDAIRSQDATPQSRGAFRPGYACWSRPKRAWGMPDARRVRLVCESGGWNAHEYSQRVHRKRPAFPHAMVLRLIPRSPVTGFLATVAGGSLRRLDTSIGVSGPHDFAVRETRRSSKAEPRPPHPAPTFVTMANAPCVRKICQNLRTGGSRKPPVAGTEPVTPQRRRA